MSTPLSRNGLVVLGVLSLHVGLIWALHSSLVAPAAELIVKVSLLAQAPDGTAQVATEQAAPANAPPPSKTAAVTRPVTAQQKPGTPKASTPQDVPASTAATAPMTEAGKSTSPLTATSDISAAASGTAAAASSAGTATPSAPAAAAVQLPSTDADYLRNPKPLYPALSKRLNEQGTAIHSVLIAADGRPVSAKLVKSSGYDRLDKAAYDAVMQWRYVPGKRQGVPEAMTFNVPIKWVLE